MRKPVRGKVSHEKELVENNQFQFGNGKIDWRIYEEERPGKLK